MAEAKGVIIIMKKSFYVLIILLVSFLFGCKTKEYANYKTKLEINYESICFNDKIYVPYSASSRSDCGKQIGIVDNDEKDKVYEYKGLSSDEWIVNCYDDMGDTFMLMREMNTKDIPEGMYSEYIWNN